MRLLLDEMFPPAVARALREPGYDVVAVLEVDELVAACDAEVFSWAQRERRAMVTENVADFLAFEADARAQGHVHHGLLFVLKEGLPPSPAPAVHRRAGSQARHRTRRPSGQPRRQPGGVALTVGAPSMTYIG